jgi:hypothetical protein
MLIFKKFYKKHFYCKIYPYKLLLFKKKQYILVKYRNLLLNLKYVNTKIINIIQNLE